MSKWKSNIKIHVVLFKLQKPLFKQHNQTWPRFQIINEEHAPEIDVRECFGNGNKHIAVNKFL